MRQHSGRPVIAIVTNRYSAFQKPIIDSISSRLNEAGYGLLCIAGRALATNSETINSPPTSNAIYSVATQFDVRGFIVLSVTIGYNALQEQVDNLVNQFKGKPLVSFGVKVPGVCSITMDNYRHMLRLMEHMTKDSHRRRFVFIRGFRNMPDSADRERAFRDILSKKNIEIDEKLIVDGNFMRTDSFQAMTSLLTKTQDIDAVVAASDSMAISAIHALNNQGLRVPEDVIVSGFDGSSTAFSSSPPITTVNYDLVSRAKYAVDSVIAQINGESGYPCADVPENLDGNLIIQASTQPQHTPDVGGTGFIDRCTLLRHITLLFEWKAPMSPERLSVKRVVEDINCILDGGIVSDESTLARAISEIKSHPEQLPWWRHFHHYLSQFLKPFAGACTIPPTDSELADVLAKINESIWSAQEKIDHDTFMHQQAYGSLQLQLSAVGDLNELFPVLRQIVRDLDIVRFFMVLYEMPGSTPDTHASLSFVSKGSESECGGKASFSVSEILPDPLRAELDSGLLILWPLCAGSTHYGYILIDPKNLEQLNMEYFATHLGNTVRNFTQLQALRRGHNLLEKMVDNEKAVNRSLQNEVDLREKIEAQNRSLQNELIHLTRLHSLEQMATGMAHELNQPLTAIVQNAETATLCALESAIDREELADILSDISGDAHRAGEIIRSLRRFVNKDSSSRLVFNLRELLIQARNMIETDASSANIDIQIECIETLKIFADRIQLAQVLINLMRNSVDAIVSADCATAKIVISAMRVNQAIEISIKDSGPGLRVGVDPFAPFESSKAIGVGMGMGLSISRSIVESHGGQIWFDHKYQHGAQVVVSLPTTD